MAAAAREDTAITASSSGPSAPHLTKRVSYGATTTVPSVEVASPTADDGETINGFGYTNGDDDDECVDELVDEALLNISWTWLSRLYLLVPLLTTLFFLSLVALVRYGWPPSREERDNGQVYPHPFFWKAFLVGVFASFTVQALRVPIFVATSWFPLSTPWTVFISTVVHAIGHETIRLVSVPLVIPSPTSGFHSSFWLGLGWGLAETAWGIVQGWEQLALYEDVIKNATLSSAWSDGGESGLATVPEDDELDDEEDDEERMQDEDELELRVQVLERMRARHELEEVMGLPYPLIPLALHILWRIDTILLNLGLTLILSAFWLDPEPLYKHEVASLETGDWPPSAPNAEPSPYLALAWSLVCCVHIVVALVWKVVGRVGVGAVTWGGLIIALGSVFAGLGAWGGLV